MENELYPLSLFKNNKKRRKNISPVGLVKKKTELIYNKSELNETCRYCLWVPNLHVM